MSASLPSTTPPRLAPALPPRLSRHAMLLAAVLLCLVFAATSPVFGTPANAVNILRQSASVLVLGLALVTVVLVGGIDLSVGSVVLASATFCGIGLAQGLGAPLAVAMGIGSGAAVGLINATVDRGRFDQPGDRHAGHHDRGTRGSASAARPFQFVAGDQRPGVRPARPCDAGRASARCRCRRPARRRALAGAQAHHARPRLGCGRRQPGGGAAGRPQGAAAARRRLYRLRRLGRRGGRPVRRAHRPDQPVDRRRPRILRHRGGRARRRRLAGRPGRRRRRRSLAR